MTESNQKWYVLRAMSGKEKQVKEYIDIELEKGGDLSRYVSQVVIPTERVYVVRNGTTNRYLYVLRRLLVCLEP